jgi:hypothetical protein
MKRLHLTVFFLLIALGGPLYAQVTIKGKIIDKNNVPVFSASILEKGTTNGTVTGLEGQFSINVAGPSSVLVISSIG